MWDATFEKVLRNQLPFLSAAEELGADAELKSFGLDSMGMVALLTDLEDEYRVRFTDDALNASTFATAGVLWRTLEGLRATASAV